MASYYGLGTAQAQEGTTKDVAKLAAAAVPDHAVGFRSRARSLEDRVRFADLLDLALAFHNTVYPLVKTEYVDTGRVSLSFARSCATCWMPWSSCWPRPPAPSSITRSSKPISRRRASGASPKSRAILAIAKQLGFTDATFDAALTNTELFNNMETMRRGATVQQLGRHADVLCERPAAHRRQVDRGPSRGDRPAGAGRFRRDLACPGGRDGCSGGARSPGGNHHPGNPCTGRRSPKPAQ